MFATLCRFAALASALLFLASGWARAGEDGDRSAVQGVISRQIEAFKRDDGPAAFSFAAPQIQQLFNDSARFMDMVKRSYAPVYRPKTTRFGAFKAEGDGFSQAMTIIDSDGQAWNALYSLERGPDGKLRITGCQLVKSPEIGA